MVSLIEHNPVMVQEVLKYIDAQRRSVVVDATLGLGSHAKELLKQMPADARLIAIDKDEDSLMLAKERLKEFDGRVSFAHSDFRDIGKVLDGLNIKSIGAILFDLGLSSYQLESDGRGFSFRYDGPLDMRMDKASYICAADLVNNLTEKEISDILWAFGQERWHNRIARYLIRQRQVQPIVTTGQLKDTVARAVSGRYRGQRIHPATRTFQALRIAVNRELEALNEALEKIPAYLSKGSVICVISFHSLEDRIVKQNFKKNASLGIYKVITKKPLVPRSEEIADNPRSRSAKMRVAVKI